MRKNETQICKDEMNLAEFPLSVIGKRAPKGVKTIEFQDEIKHPLTGETISRHLTVTGSDLLGLPTSIDDEVLVGCLKLTKDFGMKDRRVPFTAYQFLEDLGWPRDGKNYRRLTQSLDRWSGTLVISNNAYWHKGRQKLVKDSFGLIDRWKLTDDSLQGSDKAGWFVWGDFMWESLQSGNIRTLDFEFWKSLESPVAKRLFRFLDKRFYKRNKVAFPLRTLAHDKVGISRNLHNGQIKESLRKGHQELEGKGFCKSNFVERGRGDWEVVYTDMRKSVKNNPVIEADEPLARALKERGIKNATELLSKQPSRERIKAAIENYDDRNAHGEKLSQRWLASNILHETGYDFRLGYQSKAERLAAKKAKARKEQKRSQAKLEVESRKQKASYAKREAFDLFLSSMNSEAERKEFFGKALEAFPIYRNFFEDCLTAGKSDRAKQHQYDAGILFWQRQHGKNSAK